MISNQKKMAYLVIHETLWNGNEWRICIQGQLLYKHFIWNEWIKSTKSSHNYNILHQISRKLGQDEDIRGNFVR